MAEEKNTVDYTIRNIPKDVDVTLSHLSILTGTPKSVIIRDKIIEMFTDQIKTFGMLSPLVDALDQVIAQHLGGIEVIKESLDDHYGTKWNIEMCKLLDIQGHDDLQHILVKNTPYLTIRADQVLKNMLAVPKASSLWFALFAEIAFSDEETVKKAWDNIFRKPSPARYYSFYSHINELRRQRQMPPLQSWEYNQQDDFGHTRLFKPDDYDYGAWRIEITLAPEVAADTETGPGITFPNLPERLFNAQQEKGYGCAVQNEQGGTEAGFRFVNGRTEFDVYSNGVSEERNETKPGIVMTAVATQVKNWLAVRQR